MVKTLLGDGMNGVRKLVTLLRELNAHIESTTHDAELSDEVTECAVDLLTCVRAQLAIADVQAPTDSCDPIVMESVVKFQYAKKKKPNDICAKVHTLIVDHAQLLAMCFP